MGIIGGTGPEGLGLAIRWAIAGRPVAIGSRSPHRARMAAERVQAIVPRARLLPDVNEQVAAMAGVVVIALPYSGLTAAVSSLAANLGNRLVVSVVAAVEFVEGRPRPVMVEAGSAAQEVARLLPDSRVTSGFHTLSAQKLSDRSRVLNEDTIICGDDREARRETMLLAEEIRGIRALSGGRLATSYYSEQLVALLANMNRIYKGNSGVRLVDLDR